LIFIEKASLKTGFFILISSQQPKCLIEVCGFLKLQVAGLFGYAIGLNDK